ncbi:hypothetical protein [Streptomyces sp. NBC_01014]|uniref:hypothetical protein n=1 Tax=Streptomyces sp. NBC_01014 TaxID=2903719 RepID=UPI003864104C|nr:hypothetical protein OG282_15175 [Streptomyces sp. NBC_01014]
MVNVVGTAARWACGATGVTLGPAGRRTGSALLPGPEACGAVDVQGVAVRAGCEGSASAAAPGPATGRASEGRSSPGPGDEAAETVRAPLTRPPGAPSSTACDNVPAKEGFCQVESEPLNPASATDTDRRVPVAPVSGGRADQPAAPRSVRPTEAVGSVAVDSGAAGGVLSAGPGAPGPASGRLRSLSRSPISPPPRHG